ncbi:response regulator transcription factor [Clostridium ganghwense]|uniref:Stage 0 sporulation protein A homolog n=1 Tax=Clostridium ganghwense TaxID=312089 RepID=A0ABT4CLI7_9CLOT|nr:response regulator transcription factor [Clostridium ganghwense]MCY6369897.1 response regulator transcription factor [Clostridium ganghwense]
MTNEKNILVVDDEEKIVEVVKSYLEKEGYKVFEAYNGKNAIKIFEENDISLIILDLMLPDLTGEEICKTLRKKSRVPIIMLTAKVKEENILDGFYIGADDYVTKPFSPKQLIARVMALLRRTDNEVISNIMSFNNDDLVIDDLKYEVKKNSQIVNLTATEYKILLTMAKYPQKAFTREELVCMVLGEDYDGFDRVIDTHIKNLRQKIEDNTREPKYILTIHGIGYKFGGE